LAVAGLALAAWTGHEIVTWPDVAALAKENPETTAFVERWRSRERRAGRAGTAGPRFVPYARISADLKVAVVAAEDMDFFAHDGFARREMRAAIEEAWADRELPRGASTLTQQLAKNLWLSPSRNPWRKAKEALLTRQLERHLTKRRILELYLNVVEFGPGVWGAENAARRYFGKSAAALGARESAQLAAGLSRPSSWHPGAAGRGYARHVERVLARMGRARWLYREI
jgi:monofunctional biosynthetic peptidoglycan transglycosylase